MTLYLFTLLYLLALAPFVAWMAWSALPRGWWTELRLKVARRLPR